MVKWALFHSEFETREIWRWVLVGWFCDLVLGCGMRRGRRFEYGWDEEDGPAVG